MEIIKVHKRIDEIKWKIWDKAINKVLEDQATHSESKLPDEECFFQAALVIAENLATKIKVLELSFKDTDEIKFQIWREALDERGRDQGINNEGHFFEAAMLLSEKLAKLEYFNLNCPPNLGEENV